MLATAVLIAACGSHHDQDAKQNAAVPSKHNGPGLLGSSTRDLKLPVPRTFDLSHVDVEPFATAMNKDAETIFSFVRDRVGYEQYPGLLRGPRGTLLAMAGNSIDRAALLAALLDKSGFKVRYARGTLPEDDASMLVSSIWTERPSIASKPGQSAPKLHALADTLQTAVNRDYQLIQAELKKAQIKSPPAATGPDALAKEARSHYWVQVMKNGAWLDMDPSFSDAVAGRTYASADATFETLPQDLLYRVDIHVRLEEYVENKLSTSDILSYSATTADLSGKDLLLFHMPEHWKGPADSLQSAISAAIEDTGRLKPVLARGSQLTMGRPFRQKAPASAGMGGVFSMLRGEGSRNSAPLASAEFVDFDVIGPDGNRQKVTRELFDLIGKADRLAGRLPDADEFQRRQKERAPDQLRSLYDIWLSSGRIDPAHLEGVPARPRVTRGEALNMGASLREVNIAFTAASDGLLPRVKIAGGPTVVFYPDSLRIQIADYSRVGDKGQLSLDLRRDHVRAVANRNSSEATFYGQILRGVFEGTLERAFGELLWGGPGRSTLSASLVLERAQHDRIPILLVANGAVDQIHASEDMRARLHEQLTGGSVAVAPERPTSFEGRDRMGWWLVDPHTGETIAMADNGLHGAATEYTLVATSRQTDSLLVSFETYVETEEGFSITARGVRLLLDEGELIDLMMELGIDNWSTITIS